MAAVVSSPAACPKPPLQDSGADPVDTTSSAPWVAKLLTDYLIPRVRSDQFVPVSFIHECDVYGADPAALTSRYEACCSIDGRPKSWYFFSPLPPMNGKKRKRTVQNSDGWWQSDHARHKVVLRGRETESVIGYRQRLAFSTKDARGGIDRSGWLLHELTVDRDDAAVSLCWVYRRPRRKGDAPAREGEEDAKRLKVLQQQQPIPGMYVQGQAQQIQGQQQMVHGQLEQLQIPGIFQQGTAPVQGQPQGQNLQQQQQNQQGQLGQLQQQQQQGQFIQQAQLGQFQLNQQRYFQLNQQGHQFDIAPFQQQQQLQPHGQQQNQFNQGEGQHVQGIPIQQQPANRQGGQAQRQAGQQRQHEGQAIDPRYKDLVCYNCGEPGHHVGVCSKQNICFMCNIPGHHMDNCALWGADMPTSEYVGSASHGLGFFHIKVSDQPATQWLNLGNCGVILVTHGNISLEELESRMAETWDQNWPWQIRLLDEKKFLVRFPPHKKVSDLVDLPSINLKEGLDSERITVKIMAWDGDLPDVGYLIEVWVQIRGIPPKCLSWEVITQIGKFFGLLMDVDWPCIFKSLYEVVRIKVAVKNPLKIPTERRIVIKKKFYRLQFKVELQGVDLSDLVEEECEGTGKDIDKGEDDLLDDKIADLEVGREKEKVPKKGGIGSLVEEEGD